MTYGYIRISTDKQTVKNQRYELNCFCRREGITIDRWIEETISGTTDPEKRKLGRVLAGLQENDIIICAELSRLGRNLLMIMDILNKCLNRGVWVWTVKDNYRLGSDISSKVLAFAFGIAAEIERDLISRRTKEALARKQSEGAVLGRPRGRKSGCVKLSGQEEEVVRLQALGYTITEIAQRLNVQRITLYKFIRERMDVAIVECDITDQTFYPADGRDEHG